MPSLTFDTPPKNFERYLKKNRLLPKEKKERYRRFMEYTKALARLTMNPDKERHLIQAFLTKLNNSQPIALHSWLEEKAEELLQSLRR